MNIFTITDMMIITSNEQNTHNDSCPICMNLLDDLCIECIEKEQHNLKVSDFLKRFASVPDVLELDHLTVSGNVTFGRGVSLKGTVIIIANHGDQVSHMLDYLLILAYLHG